MKYVLTYQAGPAGLAHAQTYFPAHRARLEAFHARGVLLMVGAFTDTLGSAMAVFTSREAAEEFMRDDPFMVNGVVDEWAIREWNETLAP